MVVVFVRNNTAGRRLQGNWRLKISSSGGGSRSRKGALKGNHWSTIDTFNTKGAFEGQIQFRTVSNTIEKTFPWKKSFPFYRILCFSSLTVDYIARYSPPPPPPVFLELFS
ncbi:unnamed protein product, partial [Sphacelaria rigidula]